MHGNNSTPKIKIKNSMNKNNLSRRDFVKILAGVVALFGFGGMFKITEAPKSGNSYGARPYGM